jgi:PKHD-type hydroxylase
MSHLPIWYMGQVPTDVCDAAVREFLEIEPQSATMGSNGEHQDTSHRDTVLRFAPDDHWFGGVMYQHGLASNQAKGWDYDITGHENVQFGSYGPNGHYGWHMDTFILSGQPLERKVSVICLMSDPEEYEGGDFEIQLYQNYKVDMKKGQLIAFPSMLQHRVLPIISGTRTSAVIWLNGPRMR